jgi:chromosome segregation ATPase
MERILRGNDRTARAYEYARIENWRTAPPAAADYINGVKEAMTNVMLNNFEILIGVIVAAFLAGWALSKVAAKLRGNKAADQMPEEHHQIRSLEASLRVAQKHVGEMKNQFEATSVDFNALKETHEKLEAAFEDRGQELDVVNDAVRFESKKVKQLRRDLTTHAEAKIRAEAHAKAVETELSVMEAGSSAMQDEVERLAAEHQDLADKLHAATGSFESELLEEASSESAAPEASDEREQRWNRSSEEYLRNC